MAKRQIVLVLETTGLSVIDKDHDQYHKNRIVELALVEMMDGKIISEKAYYFNPRMEIPEGATRLHGLKQSDLVHAADFKSKVREFLDQIRNKNIIVHNRHFVSEFLNSELVEAGITRKKFEDYCSEITDTLSLARGLHGDKGNSLDALSLHYHLLDAPRFNRDGIRDAKLIAKVYEKLLEEQAMKEQNGKLIDIVQPKEQVTEQVLQQPIVSINRVREQFFSLSTSGFFAKTPSSPSTPAPEFDLFSDVPAPSAMQFG